MRTLIQGLATVATANVQVKDIYVTPVDHTGLVIAVAASPQPSQPPTITIRHDSSAQGAVSDNDFAAYFTGRGHSIDRAGTPQALKAAISAA